MRLWTLHPEHLDRIGLVALWREGLLAQAVLAERTKGYKNHPQLGRFKAAAQPLRAVGQYLALVQEEATRRGYRFDASKLDEPAGDPIRLTVTDGQMALEREHLMAKLKVRSPEDATRLEAATVGPHLMFEVVPGPVEPWEKAAGTSS